MKRLVPARTAELRQQVRYLRTLIDMLPMWAWFKDTEGRFLAVNRAIAGKLGLSVDELIGKTDFDVRPRELAEVNRADDLEVMTARRPKTREGPQTVPEGTVWLEVFTAPVVGEDGTVLGTVGVAHDISERKATEAAREAALAEAQRLSRTRSEFLARMSHELRTPLNGILGYAQLLLRDKTLNAGQVAGLTVIRKSGDQLLALINNILDLARIEAGKMEFSPQNISLAGLVRPIGDMIDVRASQKGLAFDCAMEPNLPMVIHADEKKLREVLLNLLDNAIKFTSHGHVSLRVHLPSPDRLVFEVQDTGVGIAKEQLGIVFQPFEQARDTQQGTQTPGTGLGLAISRQLVRLMGGDIQVESQPGVGSTFRFDIPLKDQPSTSGGAQPQ